MYKIEHYRVIPSLPEELIFLRELAYNFYWTWDHQAFTLLRRIDSKLWEETNRNPVVLLGTVEQSRLEQLAADSGFISHLNRVEEEFHNYLNQKTWFETQYAKEQNFQIAYFSMEYGLAKCLPIYSGGLGVLSADHLKAASDLGLPLVAVGLLYQEGYFQQYLANDGWQREIYPKNDFYNLPIKKLNDDLGQSLVIAVDYPGRKIYAQIWMAKVGHVPLYLLDTNIAQNNEPDRLITSSLYGGDQDMRIRQEILLGIGGLKALTALGISPEVYHMNEGHSAFLALERARSLMETHKIDFSTALEVTRAGNVFTTHTPVPAGIDEFDPAMVEYYLGPYCDVMGMPRQEFLDLGGNNLQETKGKFNMAVFALNTATKCNGVSQLHGKVARKMWHYLWSDLPECEVPISHVTNGVHIRTWISEDMAELFTRYLSPNWYNKPADETVWSRIQQIPDEELWRTHERRRERLVAITRARLQKQLGGRGASKTEIEYASEVLKPEALTIGFARRFALYKRANLLFSNLDRLSKIINSKERPVQIIISGKAHPKDDRAKTILRDLVNIMRQDEFRDRIVFIENYDMQIASYLVQGVDVWLNTPRRPGEASGTSGMKAGANGALNLSILDGWWDEAYENEIGWAIGKGEEYDNEELQDQLESESLFYMLENEVIPLFYQRAQNGLPRGWIQMIKRSMQAICPVFNTNRMLREYLTNYYLPVHKQYCKLSENKLAAAKKLVKWKNSIYDGWDEVRVLKVTSTFSNEIKVGETFEVSSVLDKSKLKAQDLRVEVYYGHLNENGEIECGRTIEMQLDSQKSDGNLIYHAVVPCHRTGRHGFTIRILPFNMDLGDVNEMRLVTWYNEQ